ncbi:glucosamine-6-phosphate deaminase [Gluconacetobacter sacchari]|uniref:Glucosamine-6-phosphate deaminase n=2 Tax=Gluconacetobacter sacchari TaxID=92759 RepID=A0A7W4IEF9_9PROT|nr:glucosamine-6-phosphate deaminase [Gluconacetobacter sacchari]MBB2161373.1 glucosamine-6-phosphate deaminase [Gluconacetobacter sacchari]GBQ29704.1 6-phosphogluconolactonase [Gluconacetobacter sacchari DSM 12717]
MKIIICPDSERVAGVAARLLADQVRARPESVLGLATGRTMEAIYRRLVGTVRAEGIDFSAVTTFNLDEYVGLPGGHAQSYRHYMERHLFAHVGVDPGRTHVPDGAAPDAEAQAVAYEARIGRAGGIDLQLLGLGENGHIGFNEPLSSLASRTRVVTLARATLAQNAGMFGGDPSHVPARAITMGTGTILEARKALMVVTGARKAAIAARAIEGPVSATVPGSALQYHRDCLVLLDPAAAAALTQRDAIEWQMRHDAELAAIQAGG